MSLIVTMSDTVPGREVGEVLGLARGNIVRVRFFGRDVIAALRNIVGGEVPEYSKLMGESRDQAYARMVAAAEEMGADAVVTFRFAMSSIMDGAAEVLAYGTAVKLK
ncbi:MAG: YbjQ family protein [Maricaulaceae bacterium]|nr:YbjQ family protein [Maricaulaceae bacterium]